MTISTVTIHRVEVKIPDDLIKYTETLEYEHDINDAIKGNVAAGSNAYADMEEWAEFHDIKDALECERKLNAMVQKYQQRFDQEQVDDEAL